MLAEKKKTTLYRTFQLPEYSFAELDETVLDVMWPKSGMICIRTVAFLFEVSIATPDLAYELRIIKSNFLKNV